MRLVVQIKKMAKGWGQNPTGQHVLWSMNITVNYCVPFKTNKLWIEYTLEKKNPLFYSLKVYQQCHTSYSTVNIEKHILIIFIDFLLLMKNLHPSWSPSIYWRVRGLKSELALCKVVFKIIFSYVTSIVWRIMISKRLAKK